MIQDSPYLRIIIYNQRVKTVLYTLAFAGLELLCYFCTWHFFGLLSLTFTFRMCQDNVRIYAVYSIYPQSQVYNFINVTPNLHLSCPVYCVLVFDSRKGEYIAIHTLEYTIILKNEVQICKAIVKQNACNCKAINFF